jgi:hypothetical protein
MQDDQLKDHLRNADYLLGQLQREEDPQNPTRWRHRPGMDPKKTANLRIAVHQFLEEFQKVT